MKIIFLNIFIIINLLSNATTSKSFFADGYGDNEAKSKNDEKIASDTFMESEQEHILIAHKKRGRDSGIEFNIYIFKS